MRQVLLAIFLFYTALCSGQEVVFRAELDTNKILIGEQVYYSLMAEVPAKSAPRWPVWPDTLNDVEVLEISWDTTFESGIMRINTKYLITSFDSGFVVIPPLQLSVGADTVFSEPVILNIGTLTARSDVELYDVKPPLKTPIDFWYWFKKLYLFVLGAALLFWLAFWLFRKRRKTEAATAQPTDERTPAERARASLLALREEKLLQSGDVKTYYSRLTDVLRQYIEEQDNITALEMVSDELLNAIQTRYTVQAQQKLAALLREADMVKFAKAKPEAEAGLLAWESAMNFLNLVEPKSTAV